MVIFFFKQKTAYEIGLGIPAEPLFRSTCCCLENTNLSKQQQVSEIMRQMLTQAQTAGQYFTNDQIKEMRSEERRVGKECRSRRSAYHKKKIIPIQNNRLNNMAK